VLHYNKDITEGRVIPYQYGHFSYHIRHSTHPNAPVLSARMYVNGKETAELVHINSKMAIKMD
jgi:hypothetical protein